MKVYVVVEDGVSYTGSYRGLRWWWSVGGHGFMTFSDRKTAYLVLEGGQSDVKIIISAVILQ